MIFTDEEKFQLKRKAHFLNQIGYRIADNKESLDYRKDNVEITIYNQHFGDPAGVLIRYTECCGKKCNEVFHICWFLYYYNDFNFLKSDVMIEGVFKEIDLLKVHYDEFSNIFWCRKTSKEIDEKLKGIFPSIVKPEDFFKPIN